MDFKILGGTNVSVSAIGFGTWRYHSGIEPLRAALDCGTTLIDTAEAYGSEAVVGEAIQGRRQKVLLATKALPRNFRRNDLISAAERSLKQLRTDYIDLYQLHWPNYIVPVEETMLAMEELVRSGKIRFIGVSNFSVGQLRRAQACLSGERIVSNQVRYSLIDRTVENGMLQYCQQNRITLIAFSPLGADFSQIQAADREKILPVLAKRFGKTEAQIALNWLLSKDQVVAIPKCSTGNRAIENCGASNWRLPDDVCQTLSAKINFSRRTPIEAALRSLAKHAFQILGREL